MSQPSPIDPAVSDRLRQLAQLLRDAHHLGPQARQSLAELVEELSQALAANPLSPASQGHLVEGTSNLVEALHQQQHAGLLASAGKRLEETAVRAEAEAPLATGIVRRLIDTLANLGI
jgi:Domain of unknown function (DUF4404)